MRWFVAVFFFVFALMHLYSYFRVVKPALSNRNFNLFISLVFALGFASPIIWRYADFHAHHKVAYLTALLGLLWIGFMVYFVFAGMLLDLYRAFVHLSKGLFNINPIPTPSRRVSLALAFFFSLSLSSYSYYETLNLRVERFTLETDKLPQDIKRIRILHISDLHLGPVMGMDKVRPILELYEKEKPHMVVSTGDLVDGNMRNKMHLAIALSKMNPPLGKYAVLGNHEYYRGLEQAIDFTQKAGFKLLRGEVLRLENYNFTLVGIDDDDCRFFHSCEGTLSDRALLEGLKEKGFVLYLKHKPKLEKEAYGMFDLMLSGHTHGGVYYPVGKLVLTRMFLGDRGLHELSGSHVYISKGVGTGGPPMRLLSPPDVAVIDLVNRQK
ncbi:MAG: metallophosphoesterase [Aquificaceae bacterium]|nr:metallophosphoesterase [Aquificaceae bacterium]